MFPPIQDIYRLAPEFILCAFGMLIMLLDPFVPAGSKGWMARLALVGAALSTASVHWMSQFPGTAFYGLMLVDDFSIFLHGLIGGIAVLAVLGSYDYLEREGLQQGEYYALVLFATAGMGVMAGANELLTAFLGLEISSIASYVLAGYRRDALKSNESALKYFLLGSFATAFFLYGAAMVYGATGTTMMPQIRLAIEQGRAGAPLLVLGLALMITGLAFKIASVPFQVWTPDVYEGAPTPVTAMFSAGPKAAAFAMLMRLLCSGFAPESELWLPVIALSAALTMTVGNLAALVQTNVKRMLAYSSISHAGYLLVAFAAGARSGEGVAAVLYYLAAYALMSIGAFTVVAHLGGAGERRLTLDDYAGLGWRQPLTAALLSLYLLSLLGMPVTAGFLGKFYAFSAALKTDLLWLVILAALNSAVGAYYYLGVIVAMYFREPEEAWNPSPLPAAVGLVLLLTAAGTICLGIFPEGVSTLAAQGALALR